MDMEIRIDPHTLERAQERGATEEEIRDVITSGFRIPAKYNRCGKGKIYGFERDRHGRFYKQKRVEVFYVRNGDAVVTVTVYVFYGQWESDDADSIQR